MAEVGVVAEQEAVVGVGVDMEIIKVLLHFIALVISYWIYYIW